jgi:ribosomal protein S12 methylthiotransferase accessory factor
MDFRITFPGGKKVNAEYGDMVIKTDQSVASGGEGTAPEPFMMFLASLGTCAGIYVLSFIRNRDISTEGLELIQHNEFVMNDKGVPNLTKITIDIKVPVGFPEKYHEAIIRVADQCKVKHTIQNPPEFEIKVVV